MVSEEIVVSTRKGLFRVVRNTRRWDIDSVEFLGDNVSLALTDARSGFGYAALDHGHFGVKLHRSTGDWLAGNHRADLSAKARGTRRERHVGPSAFRGAPQRIWALACWRCGRAGRDFGAARCPAVCFVRPITAIAGQWSVAMGSPEAHAVDGRRRRPGPAFIRSLSIRAIHGAYGSPFLPAASGSPTMRAKAGRSAARACAPNTCPQNSLMIRSRRMFIASCNVRPRRERMWVQHHNGIFVSSDEGRTFHEITGVKPSDLRLSGRRASAGRRHGVVRPRDQGRKAHSARRPPGRHAHPERRQELRRTDQRPAAARTPTTSFTATRWRLDETGDRLAFRFDDGRPVDQRGPGRQLVMRDTHAAADICGAFRLIPDSPLMARLGPSVTSAIRSLWDGKRTLRRKSFQLDVVGKPRESLSANYHRFIVLATNRIGYEYTIADMICYPWTVNWKAQGQDIDEFKYFKRWFDELSARPAVQRGLAVTASPTEDPESLPAEEREQHMRLLYNQRARPALAEGGPPSVCPPNNQTAIAVLSGFWGWPPSCDYPQHCSNHYTYYSLLDQRREPLQSPTRKHFGSNLQSMVGD